MKRIEHSNDPKAMRIGIEPSHCTQVKGKDAEHVEKVLVESQCVNLNLVIANEIARIRVEADIKRAELVSHAPIRLLEDRLGR